MIVKDIIDFATRLEIDAEGVGARPEKKRDDLIIVIHTRPDGEGIKFESYETLNTNEKICAFLERTPDLKFSVTPDGFRHWITRQINLQDDPNKRLGSMSGPMNSVPYVVKLSKNNLKVSEKNPDGFRGKINKMKASKEVWKDDGKVSKAIKERLTECSKKAYLAFWDSISNEPRNGIMDTLVFVLFPQDIGGYNRRDVYVSFESDRGKEWGNKKFVTKKSEICPVCNNIRVLGPLSGETYQSKKPFLKRIDRPDEYGLRVCLECMGKYRDAEKRILNAGFRIFPIFGEGTIPSKNFHLLEDDGRPKSFHKIFSDLKKTDRTRFDFQLVGFSEGTLWLCDYITGYSPYFEPEAAEQPNENTYSRFSAESDFWGILGVKYNYPYFQTLKEIKKHKDLRNIDNSSISFILGVRERVFDFVYRGDDVALGRKDVTTAVDLRVKRAIYGKADCESACREIVQKGTRLLRMFETVVVPEKNRQKADKGSCQVLGRCNDMGVVLEEDRQKAKLLGKVFRGVIGLSEAGNKHNLLSLALDKPDIDGVKSVLARLLDKFKHKFNELKPDEQRMISDALGAEYSVKQFEPLKVYFYAGYFEVGE